MKLAIIKEGLKKFPNDSNMLFTNYFFEAFSFFNQKEYTKAIDLFKRSLQYNYDPTAIKNIAFSYYNLNKFSEAIPYFSEVISGGKSRDSQTFYLRGMSYLKTGQLVQSCADFRMAQTMGYAVNPQLIANCK
jgi:tetratricopeptide (TPR) repeat protein